ncbi:MAG TPA: spermidine/putrescine ABC transporter substrate-binding protein [Ilumatobacteraceae bacterium]|nr:spermidine/putrescine ABC transporter substrate-binding protein [Ilumatobacteraceae bacterium]
MTNRRPIITPRMNRSAMTRRQLLIRAGALGAVGVSLPSLLAACGGSDSDSGSTGSLPSTGTAGSGDGGGGGLFFENWPAYIDPGEDGATGTVDRFMEATGIDMRYTEAYNDNTEYFAKIQPLLGRGETIDPDIIAPTGWMAGRLLTLGWLDKLPLDKVPNAAKLRADLQNPSWDPDGEYTLPWQTGFAGIAYNIDVTGRELTSVDDLFDPEFAGKVGALSEMRDTIGLLLMAEGIDISKLTTFEEAAPAFERLEKAKADGQIRRFHGNDYFDDLSNGNFAATIGWSGDVASIARDNPSVRFVFPESGATAWADTMVVPKGAKNVDAAAQWMNFVYDPVQAAQITAYVGYVSPVDGVRDEVLKLDPTLAEDTLIFPDDATLAQTQTFAQLSEDVEAEYDAAFSAITGA